MRRNLPLLLAAGFAIFAMVALGLALAWRAADQVRLEEGRKQNERSIAAIRRLAGQLEEGRVENCRTIEALKTEFRSDAKTDFRNLGRTARLLGITVTPELRKAARESRDATLRRFASIDCTKEES